MTRQSIQPTYDSRDTGPRYNVTTEIGDRTIEFRKPIDDPFVSQTVHIHWRDLVRHLLGLRRFLTVTVRVNGDRDVIEAVLELDANYLGLPGSQRRTAFNQEINDTLGGIALAEELNEERSEDPSYPPVMNGDSPQVSGLGPESEGTR